MKSKAVSEAAAQGEAMVGGGRGLTAPRVVLVGVTFRAPVMMGSESK